MTGTATATSVTMRTRLTAAQFVSIGGDFGSDSRRTRLRASVPAGSAMAISAHLPLDAGDLMWTARGALEPNVELAVGARVDGDRAAWVERAAGRRRQWAGGFAWQHPRFAAEVGDRVDQRPGVRVRRIVDDVVGGPDLDDASEVHHRDAVRDDARDREVVRHEHHGHVQRAAKIADEVENRSCQRDVEGARG